MEHGINLRAKADLLDDHWAPGTVTTFNGNDVMVVRAKDEFVWHSHEDTDDFFMVLSGRLVIRLPDREVVLDPGEVFVLPAGVEHQPFAPDEATILLIEPTGTPNTGDASSAARRVEV